MTPLIDPDLTSPDHHILITGGVRSGKSRYGETLLADSAEVTYLATGPVPDPATDPEWAARIVDHRARRPAHWSTIESSDVAGVLGSVSGAIMIDCLGTWLTESSATRAAAILSPASAQPRCGWRPGVMRIDELLAWCIPAPWSAPASRWAWWSSG
jgi:hypothetical protein